MTPYKTPVKDLLFSAVHLANLDSINQLPGYEEATEDLLSAVLDEAAKIAEEVLAPLNQTGDQEGVKLNEGNVQTAKGWKEAYHLFIQSGWNGLPFPESTGGQGLPWLFATVVQEIWNSANMSFALCPLLTQGAIEAIHSHASEELKEIYLENLVSGVWTGTMNLTEPHAGTDLAAIKTKAIKSEDHYLLSGQKIFITYGDHDMTDNIVHLVLAKTPDAPEGIKGISLFIVPKFLPDENGNWNIRNDIETVSLEHKLGIHASPTCVLSYGSKQGAIGYLVGEENQGMMYMFTMMNAARQSVGVQANGVAERAYQQALGFAAERVQGTAIESPKGDRVTIIHHPDVQRMLMTQRCRIEALRSLGLTNAAAIDMSLHHPDENERESASQFVDIMIPIVKGYSTECGLDNVSLALQIHGGMGFIEETGAAQFYRDQRITPIYEGTTGIQGLDLIGRKTLRDGGETAQFVIEKIRSDINELESNFLIEDKVKIMNSGLDKLADTINFIIQSAGQDIRIPAAICVPYLNLWGIITCGWQMLKASAVSIQLDTQETDPFYQQKQQTAHFYFNNEMPKIAYYHSIIQNCQSDTAQIDTNYFNLDL